MDFDRRPGFEVQLRKMVVQQANQVEIPVELLLVMQAADDVHFGAAGVDRLLAAGQNLLVAHQIAPRIAEIRAKRAEDAAIDADVRGVEMRVDVVKGAVAVFPLAHQIGQLAELVQMHFGAVEKQSIVGR
jgi:hypothetical protein